jgi:predicted metalloprotease with PDZ domain
LAQFGVALEMRATTGPDDRGGTARAANGEPLALGATTRDREHGLELVSVLDGGPAERAGLQAGDVLVALDRLRTTSRNLARRLGRFEAGERVSPPCSKDAGHGSASSLGPNIDGGLTRGHA